MDWKDLIQFIWTPFIAWWIYDKKTKDSDLRNMHDKIIRMEAEKASKEELRDILKEAFEAIEANNRYTRHTMEMQSQDIGEIKVEISRLAAIIKERHPPREG